MQCPVSCRVPTQQCHTADTGGNMHTVDIGREHLGAILAIFNEAILNSTALYEYKPRTLQSMEAWFDAKEKGNFPVIGIVDEAGTLLAFGSYGAFRPYPAFHHTVEHSVYVEKTHRGRGTGVRYSRPSSGGPNPRTITAWWRRWTRTMPDPLPSTKRRDSKSAAQSGRRVSSSADGGIWSSSSVSSPLPRTPRKSEKRVGVWGGGHPCPQGIKKRNAWTSVAFRLDHPSRPSVMNFGGVLQEL